MRQAQAGLNRPVFVHYLMARGTVDDMILERLRSKKTVQEILLEALKSRARN
jgi:SNF2 family DNA or RNA helicase